MYMYMTYIYMEMFAPGCVDREGGSGAEKVRRGRSGVDMR